MPSAESRTSDADNQLLSHAHLRRLEAEAIRDSLLSVSGSLDQTLFGAPGDSSSNRRSIYVRVARNSLDPFLRSFDFPEPFSTVGRRDVTNVPAQSLTMLNDLQLENVAAKWASRLVGDQNSASDDARMQRMFLTAFGRTPQPVETNQLKQYLVTTRAERQQIADQIAKLRLQIDAHKQSVQSLVEPIRQRLLEAQDAGPVTIGQAVPQPIGLWDFDVDPNDRIGTAHAKIIGKAQVRNGQLVLNQQGHAITAPLKHSIKAKTLEVWVQLDNLDQRGGGVMTIQSQDGTVFDSIVFAEQAPRQWLAGSNFFERTIPFEGPPDNDAIDRPVHLAVVYQADGKIIGYRDGQPYGKPYQSKGIHEFKSGETVIGFGIRHLPAGGNRMLEGRILRAHLYDRALTAEEIHATAQSSGVYIGEAQILAAMSDSQKTQWESDKRQIADAEATIKSWGSLVDSTDDVAVWTDLIRAMLTFQELIFVQ